MVNCPDCEKPAKIEEKTITIVIGFDSFEKAIKVATCPCGFQMALLSVDFDGQTLEIEELNGETYRWG